MNPIVISALVFLVVAIGVAAVAVVLRNFAPTKTEERLETITGMKPSALDTAVLLKEPVFKDETAETSILQRLFPGLHNMGHLFEQADIGMSSNRFFSISAALGIVGGGITWYLGAPVFLSPLGGLVLALVPLGWVLHRRRRRLKLFGQQLPDALELIARALRAGHSLAAGLHVVGEEMPPPVATEFGRVYEEQNLGIALEDALRAVTYRVPNLDLKFFVTAVVIQLQTGGDLAEILDKIGHVIRERFKIYGQVQALTAEGRLSGVVLLLLPVVLFFVVWRLNPPYVRLLFTEEMGRKMLAGAVVLQILGALVIKKIVNIKV